MTFVGYLFFANVILLLYVLIAAQPRWRSDTYYGTPIVETAVGSTIFNPGFGTSSSECVGVSSNSVVNLLGCPIGNFDSFTSKNSTILTLASSYLISAPGHAAFIPDCVMACIDYSAQATATTALSIQILDANYFAPVWIYNFPNNFNINQQYAGSPTGIVTTPAVSANADKTTNGEITYSVVGVDGSQGGVSYLGYALNSSSPLLEFLADPGWQKGQTHTIVIQASTNPTSGSPLSATLTLTVTIQYSESGSAQTTISFTTNTIQTTQSTTPSTTVSSTSTCQGTNAILCNSNWVWIIIALAGLLILGAIAVAVVISLGQKNKAVETDMIPQKSINPNAVVPTPATYLQLANQNQKPIRN